MKDMGRLNWFLGIEFIFRDDCIMMNQREQCEKVLTKFNMSDCKPISIPCDPGIVKMTITDSKVLDDPKLCRKIVGSLMYVMTCTRPDLSYVVTRVISAHVKTNPSTFGPCKTCLEIHQGYS